MKIRYFVLAVVFSFPYSALSDDKQNIESTGATDEYISASTKIDFNETMIDGKMKAPQGFMLSGRQSQSLTQMVKLRSNFRHELKNSNAVVNTLVK